MISSFHSLPLSYPSCVLPSQVLLPPLCFHSASLVSSCVICCSSGWSFGPDWCRSSGTLWSARLHSFPLTASLASPRAVVPAPYLLHHFILPTVLHPATPFLPHPRRPSLLLLLVLAFFFFPPFRPLFLCSDRLTAFLSYSKAYKDFPPLATLKSSLSHFLSHFLSPSLFLSRSHPVTYASFGCTAQDLRTLHSDFPL